jgi:hypothetical protein
MFVVAKLAHRHGLAVQLVRNVPGITAKVTIPRDRLETLGEGGPATGLEVIDLTQPEMLEPVGVAPSKTEKGTDLPVRVPGQAFREEDPAPSVVAGEGGGSLREALADYNRGRAEAGDAGASDV